MPNDPDQTPSVATIVERAEELATLPDIYVRIKLVLDDPTSSLVDVADALCTDGAMTARVLRIANSAFYGRSGQMSTVSGAVGLLGTQQVHDLVLATAVIQTLEDSFPPALRPSVFWRESLLAGSAAKLLAEQCGFLDSERMFVAGLLAQVGQVLLFEQLPTRMLAVTQSATESGQPVSELQRQRFGFDYADVGAALFASWQLPAGLISPIRHHTSPQATDAVLLEAAILHIAVALATAETQQRSIDQVIEGLNPQAWKATELSPELLQLSQRDAVGLADQLTHVFLSAAA
jgi:HD-like signal output (HDOD) protein